MTGTTFSHRPSSSRANSDFRAFGCRARRPAGWENLTAAPSSRASGGATPGVGIRQVSRFAERPQPANRFDSGFGSPKHRPRRASPRGTDLRPSRATFPCACRVVGRFPMTARRFSQRKARLTRREQCTVSARRDSSHAPISAAAAQIALNSRKMDRPAGSCSTTNRTALSQRWQTPSKSSTHPQSGGSLGHAGELRASCCCLHLTTAH